MPVKILERKLEKKELNISIVSLEISRFTPVQPFLYNIAVCDSLTG